MIPEVLIVDDVPSAAEAYAAVVNRRLGKLAASTDDPNEAMRLVREFPIKVVVLDQRMPKRTGTALLADLRKINPLLKAIMLTGEADLSEVGAAMALGYSAYLNKTSVAELPGCVVQQLAKYHVDAAGSEFNHITDRDIVASFNIGRFFRSQKILVRAISECVIDEAHIFVDDWKTSTQIRAGETLKVREVMKFEERAKFDETIESKLLGRFSSTAAIRPLSLEISGYISSKNSQTFESIKSYSKEIEREYSLPKEPEKPDANFVVSRLYQYAFIYRKIEYIFSIDCTCCERAELFQIVYFVPTKWIATRQVDTLKSETRIIETGTINTKPPNH